MFGVGRKRCSVPPIGSGGWGRGGAYPLSLGPSVPTSVGVTNANSGARERIMSRAEVGQRCQRENAEKQDLGSEHFLTVKTRQAGHTEAGVD